MWGSDIGMADFREADLEGADFREAQLEGLDFRERELWDVDIEKAILERFASMIRSANNWEKAFYGTKMIKHLGFPPDHNENLQKELDGERSNE